MGGKLTDIYNNPKTKIKKRNKRSESSLLNSDK